ncbi:MAG: Rpn family recombination-promoting nuclease/putative transposase [Moorellales bacterium]
MAVGVFDRSVKALARRYPEPFVRVASGSTEDLTVETIENPEINLPERRLDFVYGLRQEDREYILHLEFQLEHQADVPERMFTYNALLTAAYGRPVLSAVVYLERRGYRRLPQEYAVEFRGRPVHTFPYLVVRLWDHAEAIASGELRELAPLLILLTEKKDEKVLDRSRELILASPDRRWRANALSTAITVARRYFPKELLLKFFREELKMLQEADIVQDWINEGFQKGMERGMEKGLEKGEIKAIREDILDVLSERFGVVRKGIATKLAAIDDPAVLRSLLRRSVKVENLEEFVRLLEEV